MLKKILFQPIRAFSTTQPIAYLLKKDFRSQLMGWKPLSSIMYQLPSLRRRFTQLDINERIVELPFIYQQLDITQGKRVLDVGCLESTVSMSLASLGFEVTGLDIRPYPLRHPNFKFVQADICQTKLKNASFDHVICLSTLEHIGLESIYGSVESSTTDEAAIKTMRRLLKKNGQLVLTTPVAKKFSQNNFMRIYTPSRLRELFSQFSKVEIRYFAPNSARTAWSETQLDKLPTPPRFGVALIIAKK